jgi:hypothetical protein
VRGAHTAAFWLLFVGIISPLKHGAADPPARPPEPIVKEEPAAKKDPVVNKDEPVKESLPVPRDDTAEARSISLTQKFGDALVAQDYARAYAMMSRDYQQTATLQEFSAIHNQALADYGKPLKALAGVGEADDASLQGPEFRRFDRVPKPDRVAWTYANLSLELDQGESVRCYDCWLLLVKSGPELRVGAFEYDKCD